MGKHKIQYTEMNGFLIPNIVASEQVLEIEDLAKYSKMRYQFLEGTLIGQVILSELFIKEKLIGYLANIQAEAENYLAELIARMAEVENVTEELKNADQLEWVRSMNNIKSRAEEIVIKEIVEREPKLD